jgi:O-antigen/teichoic acid export membrane protein
LGAIFYLVLCALSPWIAWYKESADLTLIARVEFLSVVFSSLGLIQSTLLIKRSDFRHLARANVLSVFISGATVVTLALLGFGVWALVAQILIQSFSKTLILWILSAWRPRLIFSWVSAREMLGFSSKLIVGSLANTVSANFYTTALGSYISDVQLGAYDRANKIKETATGFLSHTFGNSIIVMLAQLQEQPDRFREAFRKSQRSISFLLFPALVGLIVVAQPMVEVVLTAKWLPSVPYIRLLCLSGMVATLNNMHGRALKVKGRSDITLALDITDALLLIAFLYATIRYGLQVAILSDVAAKTLVFISYGTVSSRILGYRWVDQLRDVLPYTALAVGMGAAIWPLGLVIASPLGLLVAQLAAGAALYLGLTRLFGMKEWADIQKIMNYKL